MKVQSQRDRNSTTGGAAGHLFGRPLAACPSCGSEQLKPVVEHSSPDVNFFCVACGRCWHVELGHVRRITPPICFGCPERERCEAVYAADQARAQGA